MSQSSFANVFIYIKPYITTLQRTGDDNDIPFIFLEEQCKIFDCDQSDYVRLDHLYRSSHGHLLNYVNRGGCAFGIPVSLTLHTRLFIRCMERHFLDYNRELQTNVHHFSKTDRHIFVMDLKIRNIDNMCLLCEYMELYCMENGAISLDILFPCHKFW